MDVYPRIVSYIIVANASNCVIELTKHQLVAKTRPSRSEIFHIKENGNSSCSSSDTSFESANDLHYKLTQNRLQEMKEHEKVQKMTMTAAITSGETKWR